ncbi:hypothetical protein pb186bvf_008543 [Paramecium bursaria]
MRNIDEEGARTNQCLSLFSVTTLLVLAFMLFRFANNKFLYEYDDCIYLRNCSYVVCFIFIIIVIQQYCNIRIRFRQKHNYSLLDCYSLSLPYAFYLQLYTFSILNHAVCCIPSLSGFFQEWLYFM